MLNRDQGRRRGEVKVLDDDEDWSTPRRGDDSVSDFANQLIDRRVTVDDNIGIQSGAPPRTRLILVSGLASKPSPTTGP